MNQAIKIMDLPEEERPYEKCLRYGTEFLSDAELLAVIIRTGSRGETSVSLAKKVLQLSQEYDGILGILHLSPEELMRIRGIGKVKAIQFQCIAELSKRVSKAKAGLTLSFQSPGAIAEFYMEDMRHEEKEKIRLLLLNTKNKLIKELIISIGTVNASLISPREIFIEALRYHAVFFVLIHNHPSGDPTPSREDIMITNRMKECGELLEIVMIDHIIIGDNRYVSLRENGVI